MYKMTQTLYRVESIASNLPQIGDVFDTNISFDKIRIQRYTELKKLFERINECSIFYHLPVGIILELITTKDKFKFDLILSQISVSNYEIEEIKKLFEEKKFHLHSKEGQYLFDFYLELAREKIFDEYGIELPNRFKSKFFFESIKDCFEYMKVHGIGKIIEIETIEIQSYHRGDNKLLSHFENNSNSFDLIRQAEDYLLERVTTKPLYEIVICGKYRVVSYVGWRRILNYKFSNKKS